MRDRRRHVLLSKYGPRAVARPFFKKKKNKKNKLSEIKFKDKINLLDSCTAPTARMNDGLQLPGGRVCMHPLSQPAPTFRNMDVQSFELFSSLRYKYSTW